MTWSGQIVFPCFCFWCSVYCLMHSLKDSCQSVYTVLTQNWADGLSVTAKQKQAVDQNNKTSNNYSLNIFQIAAFSFTLPVCLCLRLIEWMSWWKKKREEVLSEWIGHLHSAVGSKSLFPSNQINRFFFFFLCLKAIVARHIQRDSFYSHFYFCLIIFFHYRNTFASSMGLFFFTLFDMPPRQRNRKEKRKQTEISIFSFSPEGMEEYIWIIFSTEMTHPK